MLNHSRISGYKITKYLSNYRTSNPSFEINKNDSSWVLKNEIDNLINSSYSVELKNFYNDINNRGLIHTWFRSLKSSQTMAINYFGVLSCEQEIFCQILERYNCPINKIDSFYPYFEYLEEDMVLGGNPENFDKTNFDFVLKANTNPIYFEFKYTEKEFGMMDEDVIKKHDNKKDLPLKDNYEYKFSKLYKGLLEDIGVNIKSLPAFYKDYQIWRNITYTKYGHVFFVFPEFREDLTEEINNCLEQMTNIFYKNRVHIMHTDEVSKELMQCTSNKKVSGHFSKFWEKYFGFL